MVEQLIRDQNHIPVAGGVSSASATTVLPFTIDSATGRLLVDMAGGGTGTVTDVSVVSANGFAGSVATSTTTPAITLSTTVNAPVLAGNGTAIAAATTTGSGSTVVLATAPTFPTTITVGAAAGATGDILLKGTTSGTVTLTVADAAGTWTLQLPANDGDSGQVLTTDGAGVTTWETPAGGGNVSNVGTPVDNQIAIWTGATTIEGVAGLTFDGTTLTTTAVTVDNLSIDLNTISSTSGNINITPVAGSAIVLDATISVDAGVVTGITSLGVTGTRVTAGFFTDLTVTNAIAGSITGNAATVTTANEATDTTCFVTFASAATGSLPVLTNTNMTFNSNTGVATFASTVLTTTDINGGTVDGTTIGATSATTIVGTTITANTGFLPDANDGAYLGQSGTAFSDLFLASGALIDFAAGNSVITHSSAVLTVSTGDLRVTTAGTNSASVVTVGGTQTLTAKTISSSILTGQNIFAENGRLALDQTLSADGTYTGITIAGTAGATLAFGDLIYLAAADSRWELVDADSVTTAGPVWIGMCVLAAAADGDPTEILLQGNIRADAAFPALTVSAPVYAGTTAGDIQVAAPSGDNDVVRIVGHAITADSIYFNPSTDWVVLVV